MVSKSDTVHAWSRFLDKLLVNWDNLSNVDKMFYASKGIDYKKSINKSVKKK